MFARDRHNIASERLNVQLHKILNYEIRNVGQFSAQLGPVRVRAWQAPVTISNRFSAAPW